MITLNRYRHILGLFLFGTGFLASAALAEKPTAPVEVGYTLPSTIQTGDEITTVIRLTAESDLIQIYVSVSPGEGLEILSTPTEARYLNVKQGETREFEVKVRLTDPKEGFLNVFAVTTTRFQQRSKGVAIPYRVTAPMGNP